MTSFLHTLEAKSDQLNAVDIQGLDLVIRIRDVKLIDNRDQPMSIYYDGDNNRPWKPSLGMRRILAGCYGDSTQNLIGKHVKLFCDPEVTFGKDKVGGLRIKAVSDIPAAKNFIVTERRNKRATYTVERLDVQTAEYPDDKFQAALPKMAETMASGKMTLQQVIAHCQKTGTLSAAQLAALEELQPIDLDESTTEENA